MFQKRRVSLKWSEIKKNPPTGSLSSYNYWWMISRLEGGSVYINQDIHTSVT